MAKTYCEAFPSRSVRVFDPAASVGGSWAEERLYPGLKTNNVIGSYEFSDFPMDPSRYGVALGSHIPGHVVHQYLVDAVRHFGLEPRLQLQTNVDAATLRADGTWLLSCRSTKLPASTVQEIVADQLIVATGLTSEPKMPTFTGQNLFGRTIMHSKELKPRADELAQAKRVVVIGGNKSAWDVCYSVASKGGHADMVMRPSGGGPSWVWPKFLRPFRASLSRLASTRFCSLFDPWPFADQDWLLSPVRRFLHRTLLGRLLTAIFWGVLGRWVKVQNGYASHVGTKQLTPWSSVYWMGNSLSIHNYDTHWFELARQGRIHVHIAAIESLSAGSVHLSNGSTLDADALVCCTGWKSTPPIEFRPVQILEQLGLPSESPTHLRSLQEARSHLFALRPALKSAPMRRAEGILSLDHIKESITPFRLYRYMVPPQFIQSRNLAFIGMHLSVHALAIAQAQALWITAYMTRKLPSLEDSHIVLEAVEREVDLHAEYGRIRRPKEANGAGSRCPDLVFDNLPYIDSLLADLGLVVYRKPNSWAEIFTAYTLVDYRGLVQEWLQTQAKRDKLLS